MAAVKKTVRKKKRERKNVERGQAHIQSTFNNTLITLTDMDGNALSWSSAAANGVLLREPLKPFEPALDQLSAFPSMSVSVIRVLLKVDWI